MLKFKIKTQNGLILKTMNTNRNTWYLASAFCGGDDSCPFIGYKAPTRIAEMQKKGIIISRWSDRTTALGTRLKEYRLNDSYRFDYSDFLDTIFVNKKNE